MSREEKEMKQWYLLYCKRGGQAKAKMHLENQGVECFYPQIQVEKIIRGSKKQVDEPLFPSYIFVCFDPQEVSFVSVRSTRGVSNFIAFGAQPAVVPNSVIEKLRTIEDEQATLVHSTAPKKGDKVMITQGQFKDLEAIYQESDGEKRSILLIHLISQPVKVTLDNKEINFKG